MTKYKNFLVIVGGVSEINTRFVVSVNLTKKKSKKTLLAYPFVIAGLHFSYDTLSVSCQGLRG